MNLVSEYEDFYSFELSENTIDWIYQCMQPDEAVLKHLYTVEILVDSYTPTTIKQALSCVDKYCGSSQPS